VTNQELEFEIRELRKSEIRRLALAILDDEHGIKCETWEILLTLLVKYDSMDIALKVKTANGRYYLDNGGSNGQM
jgi:hypothetical protein